jgi:hypothetical protein
MLTLRARWVFHRTHTRALTHTVLAYIFTLRSSTSTSFCSALQQVQQMVDSMLSKEATQQRAKLLESLRVIVFGSSEYQRKETLVKW